MPIRDKIRCPIPTRVLYVVYSRCINMTYRRHTYVIQNVCVFTRSANMSLCPLVLRYRVRVTQVTNGNAERNKLKIAEHTHTRSHRKRNKWSTDGRKIFKQTKQPHQSPVGRILTRKPVLRVLRDRITTYHITKVRCRRGCLRQTMAGRYYCLCGTFCSRAHENPTPTKLNRTKTIIVKIVITKLYGMFKIRRNARLSPNDEKDNEKIFIYNIFFFQS